MICEITEDCPVFVDWLRTMNAEATQLLAVALGDEGYCTPWSLAFTNEHMEEQDSMEQLNLAISRLADRANHHGTAGYASSPNLHSKDPSPNCTMHSAQSAAFKNNQ